MKDLLRLSADESAEVRFWAVRGLIPHESMDAAPAAARLREAVRDSDRRVRTEAVRTLGQHKDEASVKVLLEALNDTDSWISVSAAEGLGQQPDRAELVAPKLAKRPARPVRSRFASPRARHSAASEVRARRRSRWRRPRDYRNRPGAAAAVAAARARRRSSSRSSEYRAIVERWVVPDYNGAPKPRAIWDTPRGTIELELFPGDSPLGVEFFMRVHDSKEIIGTQFTRLVPNFVAQQQGIRNDVVLRDEVSRRGLTRGNLSWASAGLDTGRPGYTLGVTPQPHNEGNFTALGRVVSGMDVLERIELNDPITAVRIIRNP